MPRRKPTSSRLDPATAALLQTLNPHAAGIDIGATDADLRQTIQAATNKSEAFNRFIRWVFFGGQGVIACNNRTLQRKRIKYSHLVANCVIFHNVYAQTQVLHQLAQEGYAVEEEVLARMSPYLTAHVNRFGSYTLDFQREVPPPDYTLCLPSLAA